jgi:hypothetical protein
VNIEGFCRFCGQNNLESMAEYGTIEQANECATLHCECYEAKKYQDKKRAEEERKQAIKRATEKIEDLFGSGAAGYDLVSVKKEVKEHMLNSATMIYDDLLKDIAINITSCMKVKISKSAKGKLTFMRSDATVLKQEG